MTQIHHFLTDLVQISYRGLILGANSKFDIDTDFGAA